MGSRRIVRTFVPSSNVDLGSSDSSVTNDISSMVAVMSRTDTSTTSDVSTLETGPTGQPVGPQYTRIQDLTGATLTAKTANAAANQIISYPPGTNTFSDFANTTDGIQNGYFNGKGGIAGSGAALTIFNMVAGTSTKTAPSTGTNQLYLLHFNDTDGLILRDFTLNGTAQGHNYDGIRLHLCANATITNLNLNGVSPGSDHVPPGETFAIGPYGGDNHYYENVNISGLLNGTAVGASAFACNGVGGTDGVKNYTWKNCWVSDHPYSAGWALWQGAGTHTLIGCGTTGSNMRTNLNLERMGQETYRNSLTAKCYINVVNHTFGGIVSGGQDIYLGNDRGSGIINIYDPIGRNATTKIQIYFPTNEQGVANIQHRADVHVFVGGTWSGGSLGAGTYVGGTEVTSTYINWIGSGATRPDPVGFGSQPFGTSRFGGG